MVVKAVQVEYPPGDLGKQKFMLRKFQFFLVFPFTSGYPRAVYQNLTSPGLSAKPSY